LQSGGECVLVLLAHHETIVEFVILNPSGGLNLRVYNQRIVNLVFDQNGIVYTDGVAGKALLLPVPDLDIVAENSDERVVVGIGDLKVLALLFPLVDHDFPELTRKRTVITDTRRSDKGVPD
jgi:hypothetical protein